MNGFDQMHQAIADLRQRDIFFVTGAPKSGTTWLQLLLDAHPEISCQGEGHFASGLKSRLDEALLSHNGEIQSKNARIFAGLKPFPTFAEVHSRYLLVSAMALLLLESAKAKRIVGEKTPDNAASLPLLHELFPRARFVIITRDGRDIAASAWFHNLRVTPEEQQERYSTFPPFAALVADVWAAAVEAGLRFAEAHPSICTTLSYESLTFDIQGTLGRLFHFLGASNTPDIVDHCAMAADFTRLSGGRSRGQEDRSSFFRSGQVGDWRRHFDTEACEAFEAKAGKYLRLLGYEREPAGFAQQHAA